VVRNVKKMVPAYSLPGRLFNGAGRRRTPDAAARQAGP
jgi:hypothetical protein